MQINKGFFYGQAEDTLEYAEQDAKLEEMTPHEKGEFRKAYWKGRIHWTRNNVGGCITYLTLSQLKEFHEKLECLYRETLADMYGEDGARDFLEKTKRPIRSFENAED